MSGNELERWTETRGSVYQNQYLWRYNEIHSIKLGMDFRNIVFPRLSDGFLLRQFIKSWKSILWFKVTINDVQYFEYFSFYNRSNYLYVVALPTSYNSIIEFETLIEVYKL